jgi:hypothetical protein
MSTITIKRPRVTQADKAREEPGLTLAMMTEQELRSRWQVSIKTLQRWRGQQASPNSSSLKTALSVICCPTSRPTRRSVPKHYRSRRPFKSSR